MILGGNKLHWNKNDWDEWRQGRKDTQQQHHSNTGTGIAHSSIKQFSLYEWLARGQYPYLMLRPKYLVRYRERE